MGRSKPPSKKPQPRGVDFKKYKKKLGRKLPPPTNFTNTEIKSKAIILPEQSIALDKEGVAVSKKGLTLKELLQQTSHHNVKVRKDALQGIEELLRRFPAELKLHKNAIIEKLRERICDDDKLVRDKLYQLFKTIILPGCKEDIQGAPLSLIMAYIFKAMTHLAIDVRFMAFKFFDLVVQNYAPVFFTFAGKVLDYYMDLLKKNQFLLEDKSKLKFALSALVRCLSLLPSNGEANPSGQATEKEVLHAFERDVPKDTTGDILIVGKLQDLVPVLVNCFYDFYHQPLVDSHSFDCMLSILDSIALVVQYYVYEIGNYQLGQHSVLSFSASSEICVLEGKLPFFLLDKLLAVFPMKPARSLPEEDDYDRRYFMLNVVMSRIFLNVNRYISPVSVLSDRFSTFIKDRLFEMKRSNVYDEAFYDKHMPSLVRFIPHLVSTAADQDHHLLKAFTAAFGSCRTDSFMKMACLEAVEGMLSLNQGILLSDVSDIELLECQKAWINEIGVLLNSLGNRHPSKTHAVLRLLLHLGQMGLSNCDLAMEYDKLQDELLKYFCLSLENGHICHGPFVELPKNLQEISISCLYYFSSLKEHLLASLASCCLSNSLDSSVVLRIIEVVRSSYEAGHVLVTDFISFLVTLISQYEITPEEKCRTMKKEANLLTFRSITGRICSFLCQMGDLSLLSHLLEDAVLDLLSQKLPLDNTCALMGMLITVNSRQPRLSEKSISMLGDIILNYMIDIAILFPEHEAQMLSNSFCIWHYYLLPCFLMLDRRPVLPKLLLHNLGSLAGESCELPFLRDSQLTQDHPRKVNAIVSILLMMSMDAKMRRVLSSCKTEIENIFHVISSVQPSVMGSMNFEQQHNVQGAAERLKDLISEIFSMTS